MLPQDSWNKFDFMLVVFAIVDVALTFLHATFLRVLRIFRLQRLLRTVRLLRKSKVGPPRRRAQAAGHMPRAACARQGCLPAASLLGICSCSC